jgi:sulfatase modifying factor 1
MTPVLRHSHRDQGFNVAQWICTNMQINQVALLVALVTSIFASACSRLVAIQCVESSNCDLFVGGICTTAPTGNHWCAYPDAACQSGYRYSDFQVGDGVSNECVGVGVDAGVDGPDPIPVEPSCHDLPKTCGHNGNDSCCSNSVIPGGAYYRSFDRAGDGKFGDLSFPATVSTFRLDKYEVTVGRFRAFLAAGQGTQIAPPPAGAGAHPDIPESGWQSSWNANLQPNAAKLVQLLRCGPDWSPWTDIPDGDENRPMDCMSWYEAMAFCAWDSGYLPTEAEWNYAATGGDQQRVYPWSNPAGDLTVDGLHASYQLPSGDCVGDGLPGCELTDLVMVGTKPQGEGRWGQSDMGGNLFEWTLDSYSIYVIPCVDCINLSASATKVVRGGGWSADTTYMRTGNRYNYPVISRSSGLGIRCARSVTPAAPRN